MRPWTICCSSFREEIEGTLIWEGLYRQSGTKRPFVRGVPAEAVASAALALRGTLRLVWRLAIPPTHPVLAKWKIIDASPCRLFHRPLIDEVRRLPIAETRGFAPAERAFQQLVAGA